MEHLREVGRRYNGFCDAIDDYKLKIKSLKKEKGTERRVKISGLKEQIHLVKRERSEYKSGLRLEERAAYNNYAKIRFDIKRCETLKKMDRVEGKIFKKVNPAYFYMIPAAFGAIFFTFLPFIFMIVGSLFRIDFVNIDKSSFKGFWNYMMIFTKDPEFVRAIWNTLIFAFFTVIMLMVITVLMASWLSKNTKVHNAAQTLIFTPHISSMVAVAILWVLMLDPQGIINQILGLFGIKGPNWLMDKRTSLISVAIVTVWKSIGYYILIIISGLQSMPPEVYEASLLDKASRWKTLTKITLPLLGPTLNFVFIMKFINSFKSFAAIDLMTQGGPQGSSMVLGYWIYTTGRVKFNYGLAMAGSVILTIIIVLFTLGANVLFKGKNKDD